MSDPPPNIFRQEALDHQRAQEAGPKGEVLRLSRRWLDWSYRLMVAALLAFLLFGSIFRVNEYASGPAVVRARGRIELTAPVAGTVSSVEVSPGQRVSSGEVLVRFYTSQQAGELARIDREIELQLIKALRDPRDEQARRALPPLHAQRQLAESQLEERLVRAPQDGVVSDLRIRPGMHLLAGEGVLALITGEARFSVVALLPGEHLPLLKAGMPLRLELSGHRYAYQTISIERVGDEVVGPSEARRFLGPEMGDALSLSGPLVLVEASVPGETFRSGGKSLPFHDGLLGRADVAVYSTTLIHSLLPWARAVLEDERR
ncbi:MAG: HlyD family efflux transporter periplasmic adaptor subunit [Myxococcales bacterium]|nr:HlyD family efflux transporter periplasmic adaptor subunit [Myxococcales bacterium]